MFQFILSHIGRIAIISLVICVAAAVIFFTAPLSVAAITVVTVILAASFLVCMFSLGLWMVGNSGNKHAIAPNAVADILQATKEYNKELDRVIEDRSNITLAIRDLNQRAKVLEDRNNIRQSVICLNQSINHQPSRLFFESVRSPKLWHSEREKVTREEMSNIFEKLMFSYPQFDDERKNDPNYVRVAHKELVEHHLLVLASEKQYFDSVNKVLDLCEKGAIKDGVTTPALGGGNC